MSEIACQFCGETGFDLVGLKVHFEQWCDRYAEVVAPVPLFGFGSTAALHAAEREMLEACVEEDRLWVEYEAGWNSVGKYDSARDARIAAVRRYRALLDGKEAK